MKDEVTRFRRVRAVFEAALALPEAEREAWLAAECADDEALRNEVEAMLRGASSAGFLEPPFEREPVPAPAVAGERVGPYRLVRLVGSGGMGVVYEAEQDEPRRRVALKTLHPGLRSASTARRLRQEAEVLARLEHPGIARVYDAGVHAVAGVETPYLVLEYVEDAVDILRHAKRAALGLDERLELFLAICDAVEYGHRHGVVHRDLKPANVLVGAEGVPKVIDFGVARAVARDGDLTRLTSTGELVGTLHWMAPEQLGGPSVLTDTRSDVYALGLLIYALVYGRAPYELEGCSLTEVARIIRDESPADPRTFASDLPAELAWIVLRALEKEPDRRYASVAELAEDVRRFRADRPVLAGPPSALYRLRKLVRRNRVAVALTALLFVVGLSSGGIALRGLVRAADEADKFRGMNEVLDEMLSGAQVTRRGRDVRAVELLQRASQLLDEDGDRRPEVEGPLRATLARSFLSLGDHGRAVAEARYALEAFDRLASPRAPERLEAVALLGWALLDLERNAEAHELLEAEVGRARAVTSDEALPAALTLRRTHARSLLESGRGEEAAAQLALVMAEAEERLGGSSEVLLSAWTLRVVALNELERFEESEALAHGLVERCNQLQGPASVHTHVAQEVHARALLGLQRLSEAEAILVALVPAATTWRGAGHSRVIELRNVLAEVLLADGRADEAEEILRESWRAAGLDRGAPDPRLVSPRDGTGATQGALHELQELRAQVRQALAERGSADRDAADENRVAQALLDAAAEGERLEARLEALRAGRGEDAPATLAAAQALGAHLRRQGQLDLAEPLLRDNLARRRRVLREGHPDICDSAEELGVTLQISGRYDEAVALLEEAWRCYERALGADARPTLRVRGHIGTALAQSGRFEAGLTHLEESLDGLRALDPEDPELIVPMVNLFQVYRQRGELWLAEAQISDACAFAEERLERDRPGRAVTFEHRARFEAARGRSDEALVWWGRTVEAAVESPAVGLEQEVVLRRERAACLDGLDRSAEALAELERALAADERRLGAGHPALEAHATEVARRRAALEDGSG